jgi:arsenate reductase
MAMENKTYNVLFLSERNSARSIIAEALLNDLGRGRFRAFSAGSNPTGTVEPCALEKLRQEGVPAPDARSKAWEELAQCGATPMDFVITLGDDVMQHLCPIWPGHPIVARWSVQDPVAETRLAGQSRLAYARTYATLERRIALFSSLNPASLKRLALSHYVREIGSDDTPPDVAP